MPIGKTKSAVVRTRVSKEELQKMQVTAKSKQKKLSDWVRKVLLDVTR